MVICSSRMWVACSFFHGLCLYSMPVPPALTLGVRIGGAPMPSVGFGNVPIEPSPRALFIWYRALYTVCGLHLSVSIITLLV